MTLTVAGALAPVSITGIITATSTLLIAAGGILATLVVLIPLLRETRQVHKQTDEVHQIVNQQRTDMQRYQRALLAVLKAHGIDPPPDQSIEPEAGTTVTPPG